MGLSREQRRELVRSELRDRQHRVFHDFQKAKQRAANLGLAVGTHNGVYYVSRPERLLAAEFFPIEKPSPGWRPGPAIRG
jgi:hypothetical protein